MNFAKIILLPVILQASHTLLGADRTEKTPLLAASAPSLDPQTAIAQYIREQRKDALALVLASDTTIPVDDLIELAREKDKKYQKKCCRNLPPLLISMASTLYSISIALEPFKCREMDATRYVRDGMCWVSTVGTGAYAIHSAREMQKDWGNYFYSKNIVEMLEKYKAKQSDLSPLQE